MSKIDDLEFDLEILRDVVYQIEEDMKALGAELARVKELLEETKEVSEDAHLVPKSQQR